MIKVSEAVGEPADLLDDQVDGFGAAVGDPTGVEVGEHLLAPGLQCSAEPSHLRDRTRREAGNHLLSDPATLAGAGVVDGAELLVALPGQVDFAVGVAGIQTPGELGLLAFGQMLHTVAEQATDLVERIVLVASVAEGVLLDTAADLIDHWRRVIGWLRRKYDRSNWKQIRRYIGGWWPQDEGTALFDTRGDAGVSRPACETGQQKRWTPRPGPTPHNAIRDGLPDPVAVLDAFHVVRLATQQAGLAILGYALLRSDLPTWIGWMLIGSMALLFVLTLIFRDMVPLMFYLVTLILGIALLT
jgi:hypothetical protein